jgi:putative ABC transport system ATP-binding protein
MLMATMLRPTLLLLDEHTAALDPKTAHQILDLTNQIVEEQKLTTLMVTHNMRQALAFGNRLVMLHQGEVIMDVDGEEKRNLTVEDLLQRFYSLRGEQLSSDRLLLG